MTALPENANSSPTGIDSTLELQTVTANSTKESPESSPGSDQIGENDASLPPPPPQEDPHASSQVVAAFVLNMNTW